MFRLDENAAKVSREEFSNALDAEGIPNVMGCIPSCVYEYDLLVNKNVYPGSDIPFNINHDSSKIKYGKGMCKAAEAILDTSIRIGISEFYTKQDVEDIINAIVKVSEYYFKK
jgi:dTDP-4-amino-4,6-dideoxygalactose transaminase